jgi:hypothetical protein
MSRPWGITGAIAIGIFGLYLANEPSRAKQELESYRNNVSFEWSECFFAMESDRDDRCIGLHTYMDMHQDEEWARALKTCVADVKVRRPDLRYRPYLRVYGCVRHEFAFAPAIPQPAWLNLHEAGTD